MAIGSFWKNEDSYTVQFNNVTPREKSLIIRTFDNWKNSGNGFHKDGTEILLFTTTEKDETKILSLVKNMPFPFTEERRNGTSRKIRTNYTAEQKRLTETKNYGKISGGRTCSKCGVKGHNSRTCKA